MKKVRDIMTTGVISLAPESTLREAMETLFTNHLSGAPVVSGDRVAGVISMTDILGYLVSAPRAVQPDDGETTSDALAGFDAELDEEDDATAELASDDEWERWTEGTAELIDDPSPAGDQLLDQRTVEEAMSPDVISVSPDTSIGEAATLMQKQGIHRLLVMQGRRLAGIVSALDIARTVSRQKAGR